MISSKKSWNLYLARNSHENWRNIVFVNYWYLKQILIARVGYVLKSTLFFINANYSNKFSPFGLCILHNRLNAFFTVPVIPAQLKGDSIKIFFIHIFAFNIKPDGIDCFV